MTELFEQAEALKDELIEIRRTIHTNPEVGEVLPKTKAFVISKLKEYGYEPKEICESCIVATIQGRGGNGKTFMLRADMDALHLVEESECDFKSKNGCMHACGHDMHTAMLLGASKLLMMNKEKIEGNIKIIFQPNEEGFTGAKMMIKAGVLENPKVDAAMAVHVYSGSPSNLLICGLGASSAGIVIFQIRVKGVSTHGAMPENGIDPINIAMHIFLSLQTITTRETPQNQPAVITIGKIVGGSAPNLIPEEVVMEGTIRGFDRDLLRKIFERITVISEKTADAFNGHATVTELSSAPPLINNIELSNELVDYDRKLLGDNSVITYNEGGMGSEDFSYFTYEVPCCYMTIGAGMKNENPLFGKPMHNSKVVFNEDILTKGAAIEAYNAITWLKNHK